ncbi:hypothetical protein BT93_G0949 [Corymbia citriodora subsp. variegata]|nr:hypothetical protein BT93_G0949 [Corymbia citriodora subsp. variegata]
MSCAAFYAGTVAREEFLGTNRKVNLDPILAEVPAHFRQGETMASLKLEEQFSTLQRLEMLQTDRISHTMLNSNYSKSSR